MTHTAVHGGMVCDVCNRTDAQDGHRQTGSRVGACPDGLFISYRQNELSLAAHVRHMLLTCTMKELNSTHGVYNHLSVSVREELFTLSWTTAASIASKPASRRLVDEISEE